MFTLWENAKLAGFRNAKYFFILQNALVLSNCDDFYIFVINIQNWDPINQIFDRNQITIQYLLNKSNTNTERTNIRLVGFNEQFFFLKPANLWQI